MSGGSLASDGTGAEDEGGGSPSPAAAQPAVRAGAAEGREAPRWRSG
jgi:hypothetical protein